MTRGTPKTRDLNTFEFPDSTRSRGSIIAPDSVSCEERFGLDNVLMTDPPVFPSPPLSSFSGQGWRLLVSGEGCDAKNDPTPEVPHGLFSLRPPGWLGRRVRHQLHDRASASPEPSQLGEELRRTPAWSVRRRALPVVLLAARSLESPPAATSLTDTALAMGGRTAFVGWSPRDTTPVPSHDTQQPTCATCRLVSRKKPGL